MCADAPKWIVLNSTLLTARNTYSTSLLCVGCVSVCVCICREKKINFEAKQDTVTVFLIASRFLNGCLFCWMKETLWLGRAELGLFQNQILKMCLCFVCCSEFHKCGNVKCTAISFCFIMWLILQQTRNISLTSTAKESSLFFVQLPTALSKWPLALLPFTENTVCCKPQQALTHHFHILKIPGREVQ